MSFFFCCSLEMRCKNMSSDRFCFLFQRISSQTTKLVYTNVLHPSILLCSFHRLSLANKIIHLWWVHAPKRKSQWNVGHSPKHQTNCSICKLASGQKENMWRKKSCQSICRGHYLLVHQHMIEVNWCDWLINCLKYFKDALHTHTHNLAQLAFDLKANAYC